MTFKATVTCNGKGCSARYEMEAHHPGFTPGEYYRLEEQGWIVDDDLRDYCPKCAAMKNKKGAKK